MVVGKVHSKKVEVIKAPTEENIADVLTKAVDGIKLDWHIGAISAWTSKDRHELAPGLDHGKLETEEEDEEE